MAYGGFCLWFTNVEVVPAFGTSRLTIAHLLASIPLAYFLACRVRTPWMQHPLAFVLCAAFTLYLPYSLETVSGTLKQMESDFLLRSCVRCCISVSIVFTWFATLPYPLAWATGRSWIWMLLMCATFPSIYGWKQSEICRDEFDASLGGMRISRAFASLGRWAEIAGPKKHQGIALEEWRRKLKQEIGQAERQLAFASPNKANVSDHLQRAMLLLSLSRDAEAEQVLLDSKSSDPQALLLLAISAREQTNFTRQEQLCRTMLEETSMAKGSGNSLAYQLLGESLVGQRKIRSAIEVYEAAIQQCESERGDFEMRLGTLLGEAGDASRAAEHFEQAARLDPRLSEQAKKRISGLRSNSCGLD